MTLEVMKNVALLGADGFGFRNGCWDRSDNSLGLGEPVPEDLGLALVFFFNKCS